MTAQPLDAATLARVMEATWPSAARRSLGPFTLRDGLGGGKRVSAATAEGPFSQTDLNQACAAMPAPLFLIREGDQALDAALDQRGFQIVDPVVAYAAPLAQLPQSPAVMSSFPHWPPLEVARQIWADSGIGPARLAVMHRAADPKCAILGRSNDRPSGVAFVAIHQGVAMLHALEVAPALRRQGSAQNILAAAALWAAGNGADSFSLVVTVANSGARALYERFGLTVCGQYHYRQKPAAGPH